MSQFRLGEHNRRTEYYPRFSTDEFERRESRVTELMQRHDFDALLFYGTGDFGQWTISYLTNYAPPFPTYLTYVADPGTDATLFLGLSNHLQYAREVSIIDDIRLQLPDPPQAIADRLREVGVERLGIVGFDPRYAFSIPHTHYERIDAQLDVTIEDATRPFVRLASIKSEEELELVRQSAQVMDHGLHALAEAIAAGVTERDLGAAIRTAVQSGGGELRTDFISSAPMEGAEPGEGLTWKRPSNRVLARNDIVTTELSADIRGYASQIHRPFTVGSAPTDEYAHMFDVAKEAYTSMLDALKPGNTAEDLYAAMAGVEESPYKTYDVMLHGYGNSYSHPFIGTEASNYWPGADDSLTATWTFEEGMIIVIQPNVVTPDERLGLQVGTTAIVREDSPEVLHDFPVEFHRC